MSHPDDIRQPLDHLPPLDERDPAIEIEEPHYPDTGHPGAARISPDTAAQPGDADRHGVDKQPQNR